MQVLTDTDFLSLWELGRPLHPLDRSLLAIHAAFPEMRPEKLADWPIGRRNRALVELRTSCFGSALQAWTSCPQCGEKVELALDGRALLEQTMQQNRELDRKPVQTVAVNGETFRLPTSRDLAGLVNSSGNKGTDEEDSSAAAISLLNSCLIGGEVSLPQNWSEEQLEQIGEKMAEADPLADILLGFECPGCSATCSEALDLPAFLWTEIEAQVRRLLHEIHILASAYGWSESEILSLSDFRRRLYLEMVQA